MNFKNKAITIVMALFSNTFSAQNVDRVLIDYLTYTLLTHQIDSVKSGNTFAKTLKQKTKAANKILSKIDTTRCKIELFTIYNNATKLYEENRFTDSKKEFKRYLKITKNNYLLNESKKNAALYLSKIYLAGENKDSSVIYLTESLLYNYNGIDEILDLCDVNPETNKKDFFFNLFNKSNINFIKSNFKDTLIEYKLICRYVYFNDQFLRRYTKVLDFELIHKADSLNQKKIELLLNDNIVEYIKYDTWVSNALNVVFLHAGGDNFIFFEKNFYKYVKLYGNNLKTFNNIAQVFDFYLYYKYEKRFFTEDLKPDKYFKLVLLPKLTEVEFKAVLKQCNISNLIY